MNNELLRLYAVAARNLLIGGNLSSLLLVANPRQMVAYATENLFSFRTVADRRGIPQKNVFEVLPQARLAKVNLCNTNGETWFRTSASYVADIISLCLLCQAIKPKVIFEIGTLTGYTAAHMALNCDDCKIYTLDLPKDGKPTLATTMIDGAMIKMREQTKRYLWEDMDIAQKIQPLFGDSASFDYSPYYGSVDLFFIDGAHSYEYVRSDTVNAMKCCHPGSVIAWHDFGRAGVNGVSRWLVEFSKQHQIHSVPGGSLAFCVIPRS
jgi:predicted O-methyltransferase YrrM